MVSRLVSIVALLGALAAAGAAALIVAPSPTLDLAMAAMVVGEKSFLIIAGAIVASVLALVASRPGVRGMTTLTILLGLGAIVMGLIPPAQALRLAGEQRVNLDFGRYVRSRIDTHEPIKADRTILYGSADGKDLGMDVYPPAGAHGTPAPVILVLHGGGWSLGTKGEASLFSRWLAAHGYAVFDVDYRTSPQPNWKTAIGDVKCAIGWVKQHAAEPEWNLDPQRITLLGRSAGAHLALVAAYTPADPQLPPSCAAADTRVESVIDLYGITDLPWEFGHAPNPSVFDSRKRETAFIGGLLEAQGELYRRLSPTERVTADAPRTLIVHGGHDQVVSKQSGELLAEKLRAAGVRHETLFIPYAQHAFDFVSGGLSGQILEAVLLRFLNDRPATAAAPAPAP